MLDKYYNFTSCMVQRKRPALYRYNEQLYYAYYTRFGMAVCTF